MARQPEPNSDGKRVSWRLVGDFLKEPVGQKTISVANWGIFLFGTFSDEAMFLKPFSTSA